MTNAQTQRAINRLKANVRLTDSGCLERQGYRDTRGFTRLRLNGIQRGAHRWAWILQHGELPSDVEVYQECRNKACVNIDHLSTRAKW